MSDKSRIKYLAKLFVWLACFSPFLISTVNAQDYFFDNYSVKQGLGGQKVYTLLQDSKDYIWLGTGNGLSRFDGKRFMNFTASRDSIAVGGVRCIIEDSLGYIWFGHLGGGISRYNGRNFERVSFDSITIARDVTSIAQIKDKIWFTTYGEGAIQADFPISDILHINAKQYIGGKDNLSDLIVGSSVNHDGSFICMAEYPFIVDLKRFNKEENKFEDYRMPNMTRDFSTSCLLEDKKGNRWFGTYNGGLYKYIMPESRMVFIDLIREGIASNAVSCLTEDSRGRIWVGTWGGGLAVFDRDSILLYNETNGLKANNIYDIIEDVEGNILVADKDNGLTIFKGDALLTINEKIGDRKILSDPNVNAIFQDKKGGVWFGTNKGISIYYPGSKKNPVFFNESALSNFEEIKVFREDREGNLWIGANNANNGGVIRYNIKSDEFIPQSYINSVSSQYGKVRDLQIDMQNNLWIGTDEGVTVGNINEQNFRQLQFLDTLVVKTVTTLYCDPNGVMWIGTIPSGDKPGLFKFSGSGKDIKTVSNLDFKMVTALSGIEPRALAMDSKGVLWIGTIEGLKAFRNDSIILTLTEKDGLLSNIINLLSIGKDGSIYVGTNYGLNRYFPDSKRIFSFTGKNGFTGIETKNGAVYTSGNGDLWFGTANGAARLTPDKMSIEKLEPLTHISGMVVNGEPREMKTGLKLKFNEKPILFNFYSVCLTNPDVVRYKVKLQGAEDDWREVIEPQAIYPTLPPGKYTFMVQASNSQGVWNSEPVTFQFIIRPPFYRTWWFILIVLFSIAGIIIMYIKIREQNLIKEKIILEEKVKERTAEVVLKSTEIEEKNRDITASIRYAERIQRAMLPREDTFNETFVLFMPKDIVSGDFYWMYDTGDHQLIAACDCTGHGVPGAFMSIIGHNSLNKVVREYGITRPSAVLDQLNTEVLKALMQRNEETINDGMDMTLIAFNKKKFTVDFAGAYNPIYVARKGEVNVYKGDRFPIGMTAIGDKKNFTNQKVEIQPGDMIYLISDGYVDQFGSSEGKKYKSVNIKKLFLEICSLPVNEQRERLRKELLEWKGDLEQVDDIMVVGTRIPENT